MTLSMKQREEAIETAKVRALERGKKAFKTEVQQRNEADEKENMMKWRREMMLNEEHQRAHENAMR